MVLNKGSIQQVGTPLDIYNEPANEFVASFIGSPSMNIDDGEVDKEKGVLHIGQLQNSFIYWTVKAITRRNNSHRHAS